MKRKEERSTWNCFKKKLHDKYKACWINVWYAMGGYAQSHSSQLLSYTYYDHH